MSKDYFYAKKVDDNISPLNNLEDFDGDFKNSDLVRVTTISEDKYDALIKAERMRALLKQQDKINAELSEMGLNKDVPIPAENVLINEAGAAAVSAPEATIAFQPPPGYVAPPAPAPAPVTAPVEGGIMTAAGTIISKPKMPKLPNNPETNIPYTPRELNMIYEEFDIMASSNENVVYVKNNTDHFEVTATEEIKVASNHRGVPIRLRFA